MLAYFHFGAKQSIVVQPETTSTCV